MESEQTKLAPNNNRKQQNSYVAKYAIQFIIKVLS